MDLHAGGGSRADQQRLGARFAAWGTAWRKGSFGSDSASGSRFAERTMIRAATYRKQGWRQPDFLVAAGEAAVQGTPAPSLLTTQQAGRTQTEVT